jgi:hypothetical protein
LQLQVYIVGHTPPGVDDREVGVSGLAEQHNARYMQIVRQYADMIRGQFFGHWHSDTFRIIYNDNGENCRTLLQALITILGSFNFKLFIITISIVSKGSRN